MRTTVNPTKKNDQDVAIVVLTSATVENILSKGASEGWALNPRRAAKARYVLCCRNYDWSNKQDGASHRDAFLIGKIKGLRQLTDDPKARVQRFAIEISDYARLAIKHAWKQGLRNPVQYLALKDLAIDSKRLAFEAVPARKSERLTITDAKEALAASLGISPDQIEIIIRG
jgi:hypothetical protein